jgi:hypothetical protein
MLRKVSAITAQLLRTTANAALPQLTTSIRQFTELYGGRFNLTTDELNQAYEKSEKLGVLQKHLEFQPHNQCVGTVASTIGYAAQEAAAKEQWEGLLTLNDENFVDSMSREHGPSGPSNKETRSEILANLIADRVKKKGPILLHYAGIGGNNKTYQVVQTKVSPHHEKLQPGVTFVREDDPTTTVAYGQHAVCIVDVIHQKSGSYAVVIDPNDRSRHPLIEDFKAKHPDTPLNQLTPHQIKEFGLDKAMVYIVPLKEMLELSLLEHCTTQMLVDTANPQLMEIGARTPERTSKHMKEEAPHAISTGVMISHPSPPPLFTRPDAGLKDLVSDLEKNHRVVTPNELQQKVEQKKKELQNKYGEFFTKVWKEIHGEEQEVKRSRSPGR